MSSFYALGGLHENDMLRLQALADNLTTYKCYPFPGELHEVPYPLNSERRPIAPADLLLHTETHKFNMPICFHGRDTKLVVKGEQDGWDCVVTLECGVVGPGETVCPFFINVTALLRDEDDMNFCSYSKRAGTPLDAFLPMTQSSLRTLTSDDETSYAVQVDSNKESDSRQNEPLTIHPVLINAVDMELAIRDATHDGVSEDDLTDDQWM